MLIQNREKKPDLDTRVGKYFVAKKLGKNKTQASLIAGYPTGTHSTRIEATKLYHAIEKTYNDELLKRIPLGQIAEEHIKNIVQDNDRGAKNKAIEMALNKLEPMDRDTCEEDRVVIVLKG